MRKTTKQNKKTDEAIGLTAHLKELRSRILVVVAVFVVAILVSFQFVPGIVEHFVNIAVEIGYSLVYLAPAELFGQYVKVALVVSLCVLLPFIVYQIWAFCSPGLSKRENVYFIRAVSFGFISFVVGVIFAYFTILPFMLQFFYEVNSSSVITASISVANYVTFLLSTMLMFGAVFEMPVLISILTALGIINDSLLLKGRKLVIVVIFFVCAIITPPDIVSQIMVAIPMILLYELSIGISQIIGKKKPAGARE